MLKQYTINYKMLGRYKQRVAYDNLHPALLQSFLGYFIASYQTSST